MRSGSSGRAAVAWRQAKPASSTTAAAANPSVRGPAHLYLVIPTIAPTPSISPAVTKTARRRRFRRAG